MLIEFITCILLLLVFEHVFHSAYNPDRFYMGCVGIPVRDCELALAGPFDFTQFAVGVFCKLLGRGPGVFCGLLYHCWFDVVEKGIKILSLVLVITGQQCHPVSQEFGLARGDFPYKVYLL